MSETTLWPWTDAERREAERRERAVVRRMGICVNNVRGTIIYTEPQNEAMNFCAAGVDIRTVLVRHEPLPSPISGTVTYSFPCNDRLNCCGATCAKRVTPTREAAVTRVAKEWCDANV